MQREQRIVPVEIVHGKTGIAGDFVQALTSGHGLGHHVVVSRYYVIYQQNKHKIINTDD